MNRLSKIDSNLMAAIYTVSYHSVVFVVPGDSTCNQLQIKLIMIWSLLSLCKVLFHPGRNSFWIKKNRASDNEGKFHTYLKCRIWICNKKLNFSLDIRVSVNLAFFMKLDYFWLFLSTLVLTTLVTKLSHL